MQDRGVLKTRKNTPKKHALGKKTPIKASPGENSLNFSREHLFSKATNLISSLEIPQDAVVCPNSYVLEHRWLVTITYNKDLAGQAEHFKG